MQLNQRSLSAAHLIESHNERCFHQPCFAVAAALYVIPALPEA